MVALRRLDDSPSLSDRAYVAIKKAIQSLEFRPGEILAIGRLADQLGVSRTPVRDALLLLEQEGMVTMLPQRGARVSSVSEQDIADIFELRIVLESYAARVATERLGSEELESLESVLQEAEKAFEDGDHLLAAEVGREIHELLISTVSNQRLRAVLDQLESNYARIRRFAALVPQRFKKSHQEHKAIVSALRQGDARQAELAMSHHMMSVRDDVLAHSELWADCLENTEALDLPEPLLVPRLD